MQRIILSGLLLFLGQTLTAQEVILQEKAQLSQVYKKAIEAENVLSMNDLDVESGYVLYQAGIETSTGEEELELENVRDYAAVYIDGKLQGTITDTKKRLKIQALPGRHQLQLYVENIGRITYGPEITDNAKGLFGAVTLAGNEVRNWKMIPLNVRDCPIQDLVFEQRTADDTPGFYRGQFEVNQPDNIYLDMTGWGMGEVWLNRRYLGSYWEEEKQKSLSISSEDLIPGKNEVVIFELKNNQQKTISLSTAPVFK